MVLPSPYNDGAPGIDRKIVLYPHPNHVRLCFFEICFTMSSFSPILNTYMCMYVFGIGVDLVRLITESLRGLGYV